ncbi:hypothetical protein Taro_001719 [Colocasia esculenta]|uniref:SPARK domain-containing protein n=1 Tax=Colocasia esculenta TaxID=4460 RepID=A0A843TEG1_COLES|nr:hypothetical protein [Colocasia esculenta]
MSSIISAVCAEGLLPRCVALARPRLQVVSSLLWLFEFITYLTGLNSNPSGSSDPWVAARPSGVPEVGSLHLVGWLDKIWIILGVLSQSRVSFQNVTYTKNVAYRNLNSYHASHVPFKFELSQPPTVLFDPIEISPAIMPHNPYLGEPLPPMYPSFPSTYEPVLTGRCPINFSDISNIIDKTASDYSAPLGALVGNVIFCPQVSSLMHIFQGAYNNFSDRLVLILASRGANNTIPGLCTVNSTNLTGGSCLVKDTTTFEEKLLDSCSIVDPLKEYYRPSCQPAIVEAALHISLWESILLDGSNVPRNAMGANVLSDCKGVVYAWLPMKLSLEAANVAFRMLSDCKVNKRGLGHGSIQQSTSAFDFSSGSQQSTSAMEVSIRLQQWESAFDFSSGSQQSNLAFDFSSRISQGSRLLSPRTGDFYESE